MSELTDKLQQLAESYPSVEELSVALKAAVIELERKDRLIAKLTAPTEPGRRMDAYYYGFEETGLDVVDNILSAVATAGKRFHYTEAWDDTDYAEDGEPTPVGVIQQAAYDAADAIRNASS